MDEEYFTLESQKKDVEELIRDLRGIADGDHDHVKLTTLLNNIKDAEYMSYGLWNALERTQYISSKEDKETANLSMHETATHLENEVKMLELSLDSVQKQRELLNGFVTKKDRIMF